MRHLLALLWITIGIYSCKKTVSPEPSPTPKSARIQFIHFYSVEPIRNLLIIRNEIKGNVRKLMDSSRTDQNGIVLLSYPDSTIYELKIESDQYAEPVYIMNPARNTGLITLTETDGDFPAKFQGSFDNMNFFRINLY